MRQNQQLTREKDQVVREKDQVVREKDQIVRDYQQSQLQVQLLKANKEIVFDYLSLHVGTRESQ